MDMGRRCYLFPQKRGPMAATTEPDFRLLPKITHWHRVTYKIDEGCVKKSRQYVSVTSWWTFSTRTFRRSMARTSNPWSTKVILQLIIHLELRAAAAPYLIISALTTVRNAV